jgi:hypothetical protein
MQLFMSALPLPAVLAIVAGLGLVLRQVFAGGSLAAAIGTRTQLVLATLVPATLFVASEAVQSLAAAGASTPRLLAVGILVQIVVGALVLTLIRLTVSVAQRAAGRIRGRRPRAARTLGRPRIATLGRPASPLAWSLAGRAPPVLAHVA